MTTRIERWLLTASRQPLVRATEEVTTGPGEVLIAIAGCGVCHTDLGFYYDEVPTRHPLPLTLGHEISGTVVEAGSGAEAWRGKSVIVPAVLPCGDCPACRDGQGRVCPRQTFVGSDIHGGFASHIAVPARGLCEVPDLANAALNPHRLRLEALAVVADAVSTPYQALLLAGVRDGDLAVFVGAGGVGGFGVQAAAALGARVIAIDVDERRLADLAPHGAHLTLRADTHDFKSLRTAVSREALEHEIPTWRQKIFECSGTEAGQRTAFGLLGQGGHLGVIGFTPAKIEMRLSNLMALDATARGNWGCLPEHYPAVLRLALAGRIALGPFVEERPLSSIQSTFEDVHHRRTRRRVILVPETQACNG